MNALDEHLYTTVKLREGKPGETWAPVVTSPEIPRTLPGCRVDRLAYHFTFKRKHPTGSAVRFRLKVEDGVSDPAYSAEHEPSYPNYWTSAMGVLNISTLTGESITITLEAKGDAYQCYGLETAHKP